MSGPLIVIMGPSGAGKSTIAEALAKAGGWAMLDADAFHSTQNIAKMTAGRPLSDADRASWVEAMRRAVETNGDAPIVLACSSLTRFVQTELARGRDVSPIWILLDVSQPVLAARIKARGQTRGTHFMPVSLLESQLEALNPPVAAHRLEGDRPPARIVDDIINLLQANGLDSTDR
jgi:gluconokinase